MGDGHERDLLDGWVGEQDVLDLDDRNVLAAPDDDVFRAARDPDVAVVVDQPCAITGAQESVRGEAVHVKIGTLVVALEEGGPADDDVSLRTDGHRGAHLVDDPYLRSTARPAIAPAGQRGMVPRGRRGSDRVLAHPPDRHDACTVLPDRPFDQRGWDRRAPADEDFGQLSS